LNATVTTKKKVRIECFIIRLNFITKWPGS